MLVLIALFVLANLVIMLVMNIYNFVDTIKTDKRHKKLDEELDKLMKDTLARLEEKIKETKKEE